MAHQNYSNHRTAESIAHALPGCRRIRANEFKACCPAHDDKSPSLSITQSRDKVLLKCWAGCSQREVIAALQRIGLWPERKERKAKVHTLIDKQEMRAFIAAHEHNLRRRIPTSAKHQRLYKQYQRVIYAPFSPGEVVEMRLFCELYAAGVKAGRAPSPEDDRRFAAFSRAVEAMGVPYAH